MASVVAVVSDMDEAVELAAVWTDAVAVVRIGDGDGDGDGEGDGDGGEIPCSTKDVTL